jgi:hypothetical protein
MAIRHAGFTIPGIHQDIAITPWENQQQLITNFGAVGAVVLQGGLTTRVLTVPIWLINNFTAASIHAFVTQLDQRLNRLGRLEETNGLGRRWEDCLFESINRVGEFIPPNPHIGWSIELQLTFRQMSPPSSNNNQGNPTP